MITKSVHMKLLDKQLKDLPEKQKAIDDLYA